MMDKTLLWITFIWVIFCIIYYGIIGKCLRYLFYFQNKFGRKWVKERKVDMQISEEGMKKYRSKHFNGKFYW